MILPLRPFFVSSPVCVTMTSYYGGHAPMLNGVLWAQVVVCMFFVSLRLYTRSRILHSIGADDYLVLLALVHPIPTDGFPNQY